MEIYRTTIPDELHTALKLLGYKFRPESDHFLASIDINTSIQATYEMDGSWTVYENDQVIYELLVNNGEIAIFYAK